MIATFQHQQHGNLFAALHPAPDQPHETLDAAAVTLPTVGALVSVPKLGLRNVKVVALVPSRHPLGETRYRIRYFEAAVNDWREYGVWLEDLAVEGE